MSQTSKLKTFYIRTFGCQMNENDSERVAGVLNNVGLKQVDRKEDADVIIYNTCSVRQTAEDRVFGLGANIRELKEIRNTKYEIRGEPKAHSSLPITIITGCMVRRNWIETIEQSKTFHRQAQDKEEKYAKKLMQKLSWADIIIDITDIAELPEKLLLAQKKSSQLTAHSYKRKPNGKQPSIKKKPNLNYLDIVPLHKSSYSAAVPISTGCNEFCTFCVVPFARGKLKHRHPDDIHKDVKRLVHDGYKDITLLGQIVNNWEHPNGQNKKLETRNSKPDTFLELLQSLDTIPGDYWLSFISSYPNYFSDELIAYIAESVKGNQKLEAHSSQPTTHIRPYIHVAMQSGSNKILKKMNRKYTIEEFVERCKKIKKEIPFVNLSTDIIVGFSGETEKDIQMTADVIKELEFDMAYVNQYSPREGTAGFLLGDDVPKEEKKRRDELINDVLRKTALRNNKKLIGTKMRVLVEEIKDSSPKVHGPQLIYGKTFNFKNIKIPLDKEIDIKEGDFIIAEITKVRSFSLEGTLWCPKTLI